MSEENNIFTEFLDDYFAECEEHLTNVQKQLLTLEIYINQPEIEETIVNQLFRSFHTIKGLSGMVGFKDVENLSHHTESYLKLLRDEPVILSPLGFDILLESTKILEQLIITQQNKTVSPNITNIVDQLTTLIEEISPEKRTQSSVTPQQLKLTDQQTENIKSLSNNYDYTWHFSFTPNSQLAEKGINVNLIRSRLEALGKLVHTAPRMTETHDIAFDFIVVTNTSETNFIHWKDDGLVWSSYKKTIPEIKESEAISLAPKENSESSEIFIIEQRKETQIPFKDEVVSDEKITEKQLTDSNSSDILPQITTLPSQNSNFVRVELSKLDDLMRILGDLVISRAKLDENLKQVQSSLLAPQRRVLQEINLTLERQMRDIREGFMRIRLVPIGEIFSRMHFVVRDLVRSSKKQINLEISGQNTEIDKLVVERMMDPMLHLVRNAVGHGIESPEDRTKAHKPANAKVFLRAKTAGEMVIIEIEDDGKGIDQEKVLLKAKEKGLLTEFDQENIDNFTILELLCHSGFSTQEKADLVSGRGVGMTVVKNTVTELGGIIELTTQKGKGTCFTIQLPLTLAIADALIIVVKNQRFAIPQASIREIISISETEIIPLENNEILTYRSQVLPIKRLAKVFNLETPLIKPENDLNLGYLSKNNYLQIVVIGTQTNAIGLVIDHIIGMREIVVRPLIDPLVKVMGIAGATELGDGRVVLILDASALIQNSKFKIPNSSLGNRESKVKS